jgi:replicative DNA helicase
MDELIRCERGLVGSAILDATVIDLQESQIGAYAFIDSSAKVVWSVLCRMRAQGQPCGDTRAIAFEAKRHDVSVAEIARLAEESIPAHVGYQVETLRKEHGRRLLRKAFTDGLLELERNQDPEKVRDSVALRSAIIPTATKGQTVSELMRDVAKRSLEPSSSKAITTGLPMLDQSLGGGLYSDELILIAARPSVGKSVLASQIAVDSAKDGNRVMFVSLEMPATDIVMRILSAETGQKFKTMREGTMDRNGVESVLKTADQYSSVGLELVDQRGLSADRLMSLVRSKAHLEKVDLVVVDYIGLLRGNPKKARHEQISEISHGMKTIAREERIPVLCLSQLTRDAEGELPKLSNLRDSGSLEQDADVVMLMHRVRGESQTELIIAKQRNGPVGKLDLKFNEERLRFEQEFTFP